MPKKNQSNYRDNVKGYDDPSYFSREYKKLFGIPPDRDIAKLRSNLGQ